jgi:beta-galactosidase/beta-glucuronidase
MKTDNTFSGGVKIAFFPWFPEESSEAVFEATYPVSLRLGRDFSVSREIQLKDAGLWTPETPNLYKVVATLVDHVGNPVDDLVVTTGLRVISQDGGTFRLNGEPAVMNGALLFGYKNPLEDIARTLRCGPDYWLVKQLMMVNRLNGNTLRMSIHHGNKGGINDPRFAEYADQLGVMFQWSTGTWVRSGSPWQLEFDKLPVYVKQVRNHPSIVMWQPGNHPKFLNYEEEGRTWMEEVYNAIYPHDPSRLISPTASNSRFGDDGAPNSEGTRLESGKKLEDPGAWNAPMMARGDMEHATGYATDWSTLREFPYPEAFEDQQGWRRTGFRVDYLNSPHKAWFDFESEESAGHPNQDLRKGKPYSGYRSYEVRYDDETIGRRLASSEWRESQAWQGFSAFEAYKKKRWLDYDGQIWCTLHGGGNSASYEKPLIDYLGYGKISYHTVKMAFQEVLACSGNVDIVYGPSDTIPVVVMNYGEEKAVTVTVQAKDLKGTILQEKVYTDVLLPAGRSIRKLDPFTPAFNAEGFVVMEYSVIQGMRE